MVAESAQAKNPVVLMKTSRGDIKIELDQEKAPVTVKNFLSYVKSGHYSGTVFHRVISGFMIQGGNMDKDLHKKPTSSPIKNEAGNGLKNLEGTIAMARTGIVDSATDQFFINVSDNHFLDHKNNSSNGFGYAVFGKVTAGIDVVHQIEEVPTGRFKGFSDVPMSPVTILSVTQQ
ncbi:MAG: peptidylprolyl isomerase [bacterium]